MAKSNKRLIVVDSFVLVTFYLLYFIAGINRNIWLVNFLPPYKSLLIVSVVILVAYILISIFIGSYFEANKLLQIKLGLFSIIILILVIVPTLAFIIQRQRYESYSFVHDGLLQTELAAEFVLEGKNPYSEDYSGTDLALWPIRIGEITTNPALSHYIYLPFTFLFPIPFMLASKTFMNWFDLRTLYVLLYAGILIISYHLTSNQIKRLLLIISVGLAPFFATYIPDGRNDVLVLFWLFLTVAMLRLKNVQYSAIFLGIACSTKQTIWFFVPLYFVLVSGRGIWTERLRRIRNPLSIFISTISLIFLVWIIRDPGSFIDDVLAYQLGLRGSSYPISGIGLSAIMQKLGYLQTEREWSHYVIIEIMTLVALTTYLIIKQYKHNTINKAITSYAILLGVTFLFSRALNDNYLGYLFVIFILGTLIDSGNNENESGENQLHSVSLG